VENTLNLFVVVSLLTGGAVLLHDGLSGPDSSQTARILGGATFVSAGLVSGWLALANWFKSRKVLRENKSE
jgi:hypothetical protein